MNKNNLPQIEKELKNKNKMVAMLAPSFVAEFDYPAIIHQLRELGFEKVVELTFGAKMINRDYHKILEENKKTKKKNLIISSVCPGIVETIKSKYPKLKKNLIVVDSPMIATAKICRKTFPKHKIVFISPCNFKKIEAAKSNYVDFVIDYEELHNLFEKNNINNKGKDHEGRCHNQENLLILWSRKSLIFLEKNRRFFLSWDKFYNDYTKIYPISGGLSKTAHLKGVIHKKEFVVIDGILNLEKFLKKPRKGIRFLDVTFCKGGCIGGPHLNKNTTLQERKERLMKYLEVAKKEDIPNKDLGIINKAKGIRFTNTKI